MSENERILRFTEANLRLEGMRLAPKERRKIEDCLIGKASFDEEVKKLVAYYRETTI